jgi:CRP-like cAMP-binding protein
MAFAKALDGCSLFYDLKEKEIDFLLKNATIQEYEGQQVIVKENEPINSLGIILNGTGKIFLGDENQYVHLQDLNRLDYFGEVLFSNEKRYYYSVELTSDATILFIDFDCFITLYKKYPDAFANLTINMLRIELERIRVSMGLIGRIIKDGSIFVRLPVFGTGKRKIFSNSMRK